MRQSTDKELEVVDLDELFNQYLETDLLHQATDTTAEPSGSDDLAHLFELPSSNGGDGFETSPMPDWEEDAWHIALRKLEQNPASPTIPDNSFSIYPESHGRASQSDPELFSLDNFFELDTVDQRLSLSQPSTPKQQQARPAKKAKPSPNRTIRHGIQKAVKKSTICSFASKMLRPSHYRNGCQDLWTRKIDSPADTFNLQIPRNGLHSPPPTTKLVQDENSHGFFPRDQPYTIAMSPLPGEEPATEMHRSNYQLTPLSSPTIDTSSRNGTGNPFQFSTDHMATAYISHHISSAALSALQTPPPSHRLAMTAWGSDPPSNLDFSFSASPDFQAAPSGKAAGWWGADPSGGLAGTPSQPSTPNTAYHSSQSRSQSQSQSHSHAQNHNHTLSFSSAAAGLGISCDATPFSGFGPELHTNGTGANGFAPAAASFDVDVDMANYTTMYPPPSPQHPGIPIGQPNPPSSRSPSRSQSPQPRFTRRRHSAHPSSTARASASASASSRRKSSNSSVHSHGHMRAASSSSAAAAAAGLGVGVGFVNFTPSDSRKILTGVAPSGSSKTKARREKEAADKRRKLSLAAVKAVREAGGDVARLEREGVLVLER
ncbi:hypothetical protein BDV95DRAFT_626178 [Massariosphaeria phaeospora]|uniref:Developmental regulatory protein wetA n=1 Tax=Massariosphaeria phaeospora TaxID=100035 RepID=A0A7C8IFQ7_9PLEO|nr:hypothetical protein BDV95DRAFT_626178 [Massariosphaeria phaeospora]